MKRAWRMGWGMLLGLACAPAAIAAITGNWTPNGSTQATASAVGISMAMNGTSQSPYAQGTFNTINFWSDPYGAASVAGGPAVYMEVPPNLTAMQYTFNFSEPVDNPVLHVDRLGGISNDLSNSSLWTLSNWTTQTGNVTMTRLSGNTPFAVTANTFRRTINVATPVTQPECENSSVGTACGSVRFNGTGITSLVFSVQMIGSAGLGDGIEFRWSVAGSSVVVRKQSTNGVGTFSFSRGGAIGAGSFSLNTATANPALSATFPVANHTQAITLAETPATTFTLDSIACLDQRSVSVPLTVTALGAIQIAPTGYGGNQTITCTFTNAMNADLAITKTNTPASSPSDLPDDTVVSGATTSYAIRVVNNGPGAANGARLQDPAAPGLACSSVSCTTATGGATCPAAPTLADLQGTGIALPTLPSSGSLTFTVGCLVQ